MTTKGGLKSEWIPFGGLGGPSNKGYKTSHLDEKILGRTSIKQLFQKVIDLELMIAINKSDYKPETQELIAECNQDRQVIICEIFRRQKGGKSSEASSLWLHPGIK